jgi:hypothetical protein
MDHFPTEEEPLDITETRKVKRITIKHVFQSAFDAFNVDRGGVFTIKNLFYDPGATIRDYLGANRYRYTPPFRILIVTTALALFMISQSEFTENMQTEFTAGINEGMSETEKEKVDITDHVRSILDELQPYFNLLLWTFIPFIALFSWLINLKRRFNFAEHLVFQVYLFCISNILSCLYPLDHVMPVLLVFAMIYILMFFYYIYGYKEFLGKSWLRSALEMVFILIFSSTLWTVLMGIGFGFYIARTLDLE